MEKIGSVQTSYKIKKKMEFIGIVPLSFFLEPIWRTVFSKVAACCTFYSGSINLYHLTTIVKLLFNGRLPLMRPCAFGVTLSSGRIPHACRQGNSAVQVLRNPQQNLTLLETKVSTRVFARFLKSGTKRFSALSPSSINQSALNDTTSSGIYKRP